MRLRQILCMAVLVAIGIPVAQAHAKLPKSKSKAIVINRSIGAVKIGAKYKTVQQKWGKNKSCAGAFTFTCYYSGSITQGSADVIQLGQRIKSVHIGLGADMAGNPVFTSPLMKYKTNKGIGLGSTETELKAAYPLAYKTAADALAYGTPGQVRTYFALSADRRIFEITIAK
jgi:hypothetical protein